MFALGKEFPVHLFGFRVEQYVLQAHFVRLVAIEYLLIIFCFGGSFKYLFRSYTLSDII